MIEDGLVKVDKLILPVDFVILDVDDDTEVPIILGSPFLATSCALIGVSDGKLILRVGDEEATFNLPDAMKHPMEHDDTSYSLDVIDVIISDYVQEVMAINFLEEYLGELTNDEGESRQASPVEHSNGQLTSPNRKKGQH